MPTRQTFIVHQWKFFTLDSVWISGLNTINLSEFITPVYVSTDPTKESMVHYEVLQSFYFYLWTPTWVTILKVSICSIKWLNWCRPLLFANQIFLQRFFWYLVIFLNFRSCVVNSVTKRDEVWNVVCYLLLNVHFLTKNLTLKSLLLYFQTITHCRFVLCWNRKFHKYINIRSDLFNPTTLGPGHCWTA